MTIKSPHLCTKIEIWSPRYKDKHGELEQPVVLIAKYKVHHASPVMLIEFTKAKHLLGQRFAVERTVAEKCPLDTNGKIPCYAVPLDMLQAWQSGAEVSELALSMFNN